MILNNQEYVLKETTTQSCTGCAFRLENEDFCKLSAELLGTDHPEYHACVSSNNSKLVWKKKRISLRLIMMNIFKGVK